MRRGTRAVLEVPFAIDGVAAGVIGCWALGRYGIPLKKGVPALERSRLSHVYQNYVRPETLAAANAPVKARIAPSAPITGMILRAFMAVPPRSLVT